MGGENILDLELDMPNRTTSDYGERRPGEVLAVPGMPNVYFSYTGDDGERALASGRRSESHKASRPASAMRKGRKAGSSKSGGGGSDATELRENQYPQARGLAGQSGMY